MEKLFKSHNKTHNKPTQTYVLPAENPRVTGSIPVLGIFYAYRKPLCTKGLRIFYALEKIASTT